VVLDRSRGMLRRGMTRLRHLHGAIPQHIVFMQADADALPLRTGSMTTVVCHGAFHVFSSPSEVCAEWVRVLRSGGHLYVSSLVQGRWLGDQYLWLLHRAGEVTHPLSAAEFAGFVEGEVGAPAQREAIGNFAYLSLRVPGAPAAQ